MGRLSFGQEVRRKLSWRRGAVHPGPPVRRRRGPRTPEAARMARGDPRDVDSAPVDHQIAMRQAMGTFALSEPQTGMIAELSERSRDIDRKSTRLNSSH